MHPNSESRAPKLIGDFGEGLVTYALIRKGFEVACVDHVGADMIAQRDEHRIAVSVKTRVYKNASYESRQTVIEFDHIEKLKHFAARFNLEPVFAHAVCVTDDHVIHLFMIRVADIDKLDKAKDGYHLRYSKKQLPATTALPFVDYSSWSNESIGSKLLGIQPSVLKLTQEEPVDVAE